MMDWRDEYAHALAASTTAFGRTGELQPVRGRSPPEATAFGESGVLETDRGDTPQKFKHEGRATVRRQLLDLPAERPSG